jgi:hypothetical protein
MSETRREFLKLALVAVLAGPPTLAVAACPRPKSPTWVDVHHPLDRLEEEHLLASAFAERAARYGTVHFEYSNEAWNRR